MDQDNKDIILISDDSSDDEIEVSIEGACEVNREGACAVNREGACEVNREGACEVGVGDASEVNHENASEVGDDDAFEADDAVDYAVEIDDVALDIEDTIAEEENLEPEMTPEEELRLLSQDMETSLNELVPKTRRYRSIEGMSQGSGQEMKECKQNDRNELPSEQKPKPSVLEEFYRTKVIPEGDRYESDIDDHEYLPSTPLKHEIRIGAQFQVDVDDYDYVLIDSQSEPVVDKLLWKPGKIPEEEVEKYLKIVHDLEAQVEGVNGGCGQANNAPNLNNENNITLPDDAEALKILMEANYNSAAALVKIITTRFSEDAAALLFAVLGENVVNVKVNLCDDNEWLQDNLIKKEPEEEEEDDSVP